MWLIGISHFSKFKYENFCHVGIDFSTGTLFFVLNVSSDLIGISNSAPHQPKHEA